MNCSRAGYIVSAGEHDELEAHALSLLNNSELRTRSGINGKKLLEKKFSIDIISRQILNQFISWNQH